MTPQDGEHADLLHAGHAPAAITASRMTSLFAPSAPTAAVTSPKDSRHSSSSQQGRSGRQTLATRVGNNSFCYFRITFGDKAKKCKPGCSRSGNRSAAEN